MDFFNGDLVVLNADCDSAPAGTVARFVDYVASASMGYPDYRYIVEFLDYSISGAHDVKPRDFSSLSEPEISALNERNNMYYIHNGQLDLVRRGEYYHTVKHKKMPRCAVCGAHLPSYGVVTNSYGHKICPYCREKKSYSTKNNACFHKPVKNGYTFGFEFESIPTKDDSIANMVDPKWGFIPTNDGSLPIAGIEFKSPTINGKRGMKEMFKMAYENVDFSNSSCGQHINIGNSNFINRDTMRHIRHFSCPLFLPLEMEMAKNTKNMEAVCGRSFCHYASRYSSNDEEFSHGAWINLSHDNRIEFRISKFANPDQYYNLVCMWVEMMDAINISFLQKFSEHDYAQNVNNVRKTSKRLVEIYQRHVEKSFPEKISVTA
jgi:hypothetical protein